MSQASAYLRLLRLDKPAGTLLLWYPTAWALWFANQGQPSWRLIGLFFLGTLIMRSAGCIVNDMADRHIDKQVQRTKNRPITSGEVGLKAAFSVLGILLLGAFIIVLNLPYDCFLWALISLALTLIYPFCKRFIKAPQLVLGLAFSMGIPMAYVASNAKLDFELILLFSINFLWIVAYDTMYAMADKADDVTIGVKSTAIYFASWDKRIIALLQLLVHTLWFYWAVHHKASIIFYSLWAIAGFIMLYQQKLIAHRDPKQCFKAFTVSIYYGLLMWLALILA